MKRYLLICITCVTYARMYTPSGDSELYAALDKNELAVVLFYTESRQTRTDASLSARIKQLKQDFRSASKAEPDIAWVLVNLDREKFKETAQAYTIQDVPILMLFRNGQPYTEKVEKGRARQGSVVQVTAQEGFLTRTAMVSYARDYFGDYLEDIKQKKREERERRAAVSAAYWGPYWGWGWGYPYFGYGAWGLGWGGGYYRGCR